jgi:hypothetical protein
VRLRIALLVAGALSVVAGCAILAAWLGFIAAGVGTIAWALLWPWGDR